jgi:isopropylmalate/homocitrate/citramalate synthase
MTTMEPTDLTRLHVYDTTLRDGAQQEGLNLSVADKLVIARHLDELGVGFIEGGWPGANPKDTEFFQRAQHELDLHNATLAAFGATRRAGSRAADDPLVRALLTSGASVVTVVAKSHVRHVEEALRTTRQENLAMIRDTVSFLRGEGRRVFLDAEHFFDGYAADRAYALEAVRAAAEAGAEVVEPKRLRDATRLAHAISEVTNVPPYSRQPYVGASAFAHKAGLHASALKIDPNLYQHTDPSAVGNGMRTLVSDMAGRASIQLKAAEIGVDLTGQDDLVASVLAEVKHLELRGYTFDAADASFELLLRNALSDSAVSYFDVESWRVITDARAGELAVSEATVKLVASERRFVATGEGNGPVNALDHALRQALAEVYPEIEKLELIDFRVRILDASHGTDAVTRVLIETSDGETSWNTVGVAANIVEASWRALVDGITFGLRRHEVPVR